MAAGYASFANLGYKVDGHLIEKVIDGNNNVIDQDLDIDINMNSMGQESMEFMGANQSPIIEPIIPRNINNALNTRCNPLSTILRCKG